MTTVAAIPSADNARAYASHGWRIFPIAPRTKRPLVAHGSSEATDDFITVENWWRQWPHASIGALVPDHLVVVDLDPRNGSTLTPRSFPVTLTVATGGGGWHLYFHHPRIELVAHCEDYPGVDLIRPGRQTILPPSLHPSGVQYRWITNVAPAPLPGRLADAFALSLPLETRNARNAVTRTTAYVDAARRGVIAHLATDCVPGNRHNALNVAAFRYWQLGLSVEDAFADLWPVLPGFDASFTEHEAERTIRGPWR
jgi:hypothetical protein